MDSNFRAGFVGLLGLPNAGKSTLINALVGEKIAAVSARPQTTRRRVRGVLTNEQAQIIFVDAPGFVGQNIKGLNKFLAYEYQDVLKNSDVLMVVLSPDEGSLENLQAMIKTAALAKKSIVFVINKIDLGLNDQMQVLRNLLKGEKIIEISALWSREVLEKAILTELVPHLPKSEAPLYDAELFTLEISRDMASEMIRERAFVSLKQELPYSLAVRILQFDEEDPDLSKISAEILVAKQNHRGMVVGMGGQMIRKIGSEAREQIEHFLGKKVFLDLHVTCKPQWMKRPEMLKELGYVITDSQ